MNGCMMIHEKVAAYALSFFINFTKEFKISNI
jgi:hypothetical protein